MSQEFQDLPLTPEQAKMIRALDMKADAAKRDVELALAMVLAGHRLERADIAGYDADACVLRIKKDPPKLGVA